MTPPSNFEELVNHVIGIIELLVYLIFALAFVIMTWKLLVAWVFQPDNENKREEGKTIAVTAVIVMFVMASIWGILKLLQQGILG